MKADGSFAALIKTLGRCADLLSGHEMASGEQTGAERGHPPASTLAPPPSILPSSHPPLSTLRLQTHQLEMIPREARTQPPPASEPHTPPPVTSVSRKYFPPNLNAQFTCVLYTRTFLCLANIFYIFIYNMSCISIVSTFPKYFWIL